MAAGPRRHRRLSVRFVTILQLHFQALHVPIPSQVMSSLPYLATVVVLIAISRRRGLAGSAAPASLGLVFVPDR